MSLRQVCSKMVLQPQQISCRYIHNMPVPRNARVAIIYQALDPPTINGVRKPKKPGGYRDSGADIAYVLKEKCGIETITPASDPNPHSDEGWCFSDDEPGILEALQRGATHIWANTILFARHPLQTSTKLLENKSSVRIIGQAPKLVELFDDKNLVNGMLRSRPEFSLPKAVTVTESFSLETVLSQATLTLPIVAKPIRGRGSHGVKVCHSSVELKEHIDDLIAESPEVIVEQYLAGEEGTITIMPPSPSRPGYWALPIVTRFNHVDGVAPYNGVVAVTQNSRVVTENEYRSDPNYADICKQCVAVAELLQCKAPIRIDVRCFKDELRSKFALFDVNMKPNMTGPGRPGREEQASLTAIAAASLGWSYPQLLLSILDSAVTLEDLRHVDIPMLAQLR